MLLVRKEKLLEVRSMLKWLRMPDDNENIFEEAFAELPELDNNDPDNMVMTDGNFKYSDLRDIDDDEDEITVAKSMFDEIVNETETDD